MEVKSLYAQACINVLLNLGKLPYRKAVACGPTRMHACVLILRSTRLKLDEHNNATLGPGARMNEKSPEIGRSIPIDLIVNRSRAIRSQIRQELRVGLTRSVGHQLVLS